MFFELILVDVSGIFFFLFRGQGKGGGVRGETGGYFLLGARNRYHLSFWRFFFPSFIALFGPIWGAIHVARPVVVL